MGEIKQNIATTNGGINNDLFLTNLLDRAFTLQAQSLYLTYPHFKRTPRPPGGGGLYLYWLWYKENVILYIACGTRGIRYLSYQWPFLLFFRR